MLYRISMQVTNFYIFQTKQRGVFVLVWFKYVFVNNNDMTTPKENTENFTRIWTMETTAGAPGLYGGSAEDIRRRREGEYSQMVLEKLRGVLQNSYLTKPCQHMLIDYMQTHLTFGLPPTQLIPLQDLGINPEKERYGIFDPHVDPEPVERQLLDFHSGMLERLEYDLFSGTEMTKKQLELNRAWKEAYEKKYGSTETPGL